MYQGQNISIIFLSPRHLDHQIIHFVWRSQNIRLYKTSQSDNLSRLCNKSIIIKYLLSFTIMLIDIKNKSCLNYQLRNHKGHLMTFVTTGNSLYHSNNV